MLTPEYRPQLSSDFRGVPIERSGDEPLPVRVTGAGNKTLVGLSFRSILALPAMKLPDTRPSAG